MSGFDDFALNDIVRTQRLSGLGEISPDRQNLGLAHREIDVERIDLDDGCERGRPRSADEIADIDLMIGDDAVKGAMTLA